MIKLNLGCGTDVKEDYINIDALYRPGVNIVLDLSSGRLPFEDKSVDEIVVQDVMEHFSIGKQKMLLAEISRVLVQNGVVKIRIPDVASIMDSFYNDISTLNLFLYGDQSETGDYGVHKSCHNKKSFSALCMRFKLKVVDFCHSGTNFEFTAKKTNIDSLKKITLVNQTLGIGGAEQFNCDLLKWFADNGYEINAYTNNKRFIKMLEVKKITCENIPVVVDIIGNVKGLLKAVVYAPLLIINYLFILWKNRKTDVYYLTGFIEKILFSPLAQMFKKPVVWIEFAPLKPVLGRFFGLPYILYKIAQKSCDLLIVPTNNTLRQNFSYIPFSSGRTRIIACMRSDESEKYVSTEKVNENLQVACLSRLEKGKGQDVLIEAFALVVKKIPKARLIIAGEGDQEEYLKELIKSLKLEKNVILAGYIKDGLELLADSRLTVFPSTWPLEGFGLVMTESMMLKKPVVAFCDTTADEILDDSCAIRVKKHDVKALGEAIIDLLTHKLKAKQMGEAGRKRFLNYYCNKVLGLKYEETFLETFFSKKA